MKVSKKTDYALRVLCTLAQPDCTGPLSMSQLARCNDVPKRFLEHIMLALKDQGWVESSTGRKGGYVLAQAPETITMGEVFRHFDSLVEPALSVRLNCEESRSQACQCRFQRVLVAIHNWTAQYLDNTTVAHIAGVAEKRCQKR